MARGDPNEAGGVRRCGTQTLRLACFDGVVREFHAWESTNPDIPEVQRWYVHLKRGMVSGGEVIRPADAPFVTVHACRRTRRGGGETQRVDEAGKIYAGGAIALRTDEPTVAQTPLGIQGYRGTYRWPSSYAHVVATRMPRSLCGGAVLLPEEMSERERARVDTMRVCPRCVRVNARREASLT